MKQLSNKKLYAVEVAATFVVSMGVMLLIVVSAVGVFLTILEDESDDTALGDAATSIADDSSAIDSIALAARGEGRVAGVVDDASIAEKRQQNDAAEWYATVLQNADLIEVRSPYRDSVLDRSAQNFARQVTDSCENRPINDWADQIGVRVDEGYISSYSESVFIVDNTSSLAADLPPQVDEYQRLFLNHEAYGIGAAQVASDSNCDLLRGKTVLTFHLATIN